MDEQIEGPGTALPWEVGHGALDIWAGGSMKVCDIRGWGHLTGGGALNLPYEDAVAIQEANAAYIVRACNSFPALVEALERVRSNKMVWPLLNTADADAIEAILALAKSERTNPPISKGTV